MKLVDLIRLGDLDVDQVRADVATLEAALALGRAILAELEHGKHLADVHAADLEHAGDDRRMALERAKAIAATFGLILTDAGAEPDERTVHGPRPLGYDDLVDRLRDAGALDESEPVTVRTAEEPVEAHRAEPPAGPEHSSQTSEPPADSTPTDSTPTPDGLPEEPGRIVKLTAADRARAYVRARPGQWATVREVADATGASRDTVNSALRRDLAAGVLEHNGEPTNRARYRYPAPDATPEPEPAPALPEDSARAEQGPEPAPGPAPKPAPRMSALAGPPMPGVSRKTAKALAAEQRDGPLEERRLSTAERDVLRWLGRNGSGTAAEISRSVIRAPADVALAITTIEQHHAHLIERRGRGDRGNLKYGLTYAGVTEYGPDA